MLSNFLAYLLCNLAGLSSSLSDQLKQILEVVGTSLTHINTSYRERRERERRKHQSDDADGTNSDANSRGDDLEAKRRLRSLEELQAIESMPLVIIKNFDSKGLGFRREELLDVLAQWAATLAENKVSPTNILPIHDD